MCICALTITFLLINFAESFKLKDMEDQDDKSITHAHTHAHAHAHTHTHTRAHTLCSKASPVVQSD